MTPFTPSNSCLWIRLARTGTATAGFSSRGWSESSFDFAYKLVVCPPSESEATRSCASGLTALGSPSRANCR
jgi:hypothetical protein